MLSVEPYKSELLPIWRFATPELARQSARDLKEKFDEYKREQDFVGCDMARKFVRCQERQAEPGHRPALER